ncbi:MAG: ribonuclease H-like domain-containing protein [Candidatus Aenigmatarchaeota archaeon]|jgi:uncharacterized protein YprB with RNaseH-like and TPR domain
MAVFLDIETTSLNADVGFLVLVGFVSDKEEKFFFVDSPIKEKEVLEQVLDYLEKIKGEKIYVWNAKFDIPFLISKCSKYNLNLKIFTKLKVFDLLNFSREFLKLSSNRLDDVCSFLGIQKNVLITGKMVQAFYEEYLSGNQERKKDIIEHCRDDLVGLKSFYEKFKELISHWEKKYKNFLF